MVASNGMHVSNGKNGESEENDGTCIIFGMREKVGALASALKPFEENEITLNHIESRPAKRSEATYEFLLTTHHEVTEDKLKKALGELSVNASYVQVLSRGENSKESVPWFPRTKKDLDEFANRILSYGAELDSDHPGFTDEEYRKRRKYFADIAYNYRYGDKIPKIEYTKEEIATWGIVFNNLTSLFKTHACSQVNYMFPLLVSNCSYNSNTIPQLQDVSEFLKSCTGFTLRPVAGLLMPRDFLAGLAFRVFHSTQYIRHPSKPLYTPEPDICHELIGHVPLLCDPTFARFSQEIGIASLGASDEWIEKLASLYWFTVEFGLCKENGEMKAYGAGLLSSFGELQYCLTDKPEVREFEPESTSVTKYPITEYQPLYFYTHSFEDAQDKLKQFATKIPKPFTLHYDAFTESIDMLETKEQLASLAGSLKAQVSTLYTALGRLGRSEYYAINTGNLQI